MTVKRKSFWPRKKPELAAKEFAAALALDPRNLDAQANPGVLLFFQKDYAEAEPLLHGVMDRRPDLQTSKRYWKRIPICQDPL